MAELRVTSAIFPQFSGCNNPTIRLNSTVCGPRGQTRRAARTPCNKWAGAFPPRGSRSPGALAGLRLPATQPQRPKNRLGEAASAGTDGRGAGPGPPVCPSRGRPFPEVPTRGLWRRRPATPPLSGFGPGAPEEPAPRPYAARRSCSARPPALHGARRRKGKETEAGTGASAEGPSAARRGPLGCAPGRDGSSGPRGGEAAADAGSDTPGCGQPATLRRSSSCRELPRGRGPGAGGEALRQRRAARTCHGAAGGAGGRHSRSRKFVTRRRRARGASAAGEEARREPSVRPERSYSGRHVAAHAPRARRHPRGEAAPGLRDPGPHPAFPLGGWAPRPPPWPLQSWSGSRGAPA